MGHGKEEEPRKAERLWRKKQPDLKDGGKERVRLGFLFLEMENGEHRGAVERIKSGPAW